MSSSSKEAKDNTCYDHKRKLVNSQSVNHDTKRNRPNEKRQSESNKKKEEARVYPITSRWKFPRRTYRVLRAHETVKRRYPNQEWNSIPNSTVDNIENRDVITSFPPVLHDNPFLGTIYQDQPLRFNHQFEYLMTKTEFTSMIDEYETRNVQPVSMTSEDMADTGFQRTSLLTSLYLSVCFMQMVHAVYNAKEVAKEDFSSVPNRFYRIFMDSKVYFLNPVIVTFVRMMRRLPEVLRGNQSLKVWCWKTKLTAALSIALKLEENSIQPQPKSSNVNNEPHIHFHNLLCYLAYVYGLDVKQLVEEEEYLLGKLQYDVSVPFDDFYEAILYDFGVFAWKYRYKLASTVKHDEQLMEAFDLQMWYASSLVFSLRNSYDGYFRRAHLSLHTCEWTSGKEDNIFNKPVVLCLDAFPCQLTDAQKKTIERKNVVHRQFVEAAKQRKSNNDTSPCNL